MSIVKSAILKKTHSNENSLLKNILVNKKKVLQCKNEINICFRKIF